MQGRSVWIVWGIGPLATALLVLASAFTSVSPAPSATDAALELDRHRARGKAFYENDDFAEAADEFRRCIELAPDAAVDYFNLGLALMRAREYGTALEALANAQELDPDLLAVSYIRGIIFKRQGLFAEAIEALERVVANDPQCRGAYYNLGVCYKSAERHAEAVDAFKKGEALAPDDPSTHYQLISLYRHLGDTENAERHKEIFARVKDTVDESEKTAEALERSRYTLILQAPRQTPDLKPAFAAGVRFVDVTARSGLGVAGPDAPARDATESEPEEAARPMSEALSLVAAEGGAIALADYDRDGDLDVYVANCAVTPEASSNRLYQNQGNGLFTDVSAAAGVADSGMAFDARFADLNGDGHLDLYVCNRGPNVLFLSNGDGTFRDTSVSSRANEPQFGRRAILLDYDHDNDLDVFVLNDADLSTVDEDEKDRAFSWGGLSGQPNTLLRNNGNETFSDRTDEAGLLSAIARSRDAAVSDFDGDGDIDLLVVNADSAAAYFANARLGRFVEGGMFLPPIPGHARAICEGDFDHDGDSDLIVALGGVLLQYVNNGGGEWEFVGRNAVPAKPAGPVVRRIETLDCDNDGWTDLLVVVEGDRPLRLLAGGEGEGAFRDVTTDVGLDETFGEATDAAAGDIDGDGDEDILLLTRRGGPRLLRNEDPARGHWLDVWLVGKKVNRSGLGSVVEIAGGGHYQRKTYLEDGVHFGLGNLTGVDVVRVTWTNGVSQNVLQPAIDVGLTIEEYVKVSASCAFLYAFDGEEFVLVNEILGIGPLGVPMAPGVYHQPDCTELTKIDAHQLAETDGRYELRLTEELREITYADEISLRVVDHPGELELIPNEMFTAPPFPEDRFFAVGDHRLPLAAIDDNGVDVLALISERDGRAPEFALTSYHGLAHPHALTLDLGDLSGFDPIMLFLDAWIYWPESSTVMAIAQDPRFEITPLSLQVRDQLGAWRTVVESVGLPTSKGLIVPVDLTEKFLTPDYHVRLTTTMCVYFDRIFVSTSDEAARCRVTELPVAAADLHYRGFSGMNREVSGYERFDYAEVCSTGSWNPPAGFYTRYGDVTELLGEPDDRVVVFGPGDEISLRFDASTLPELPAAWTRDFVFFADGWVKDGDFNTNLSETVTPLPFHGMSSYPYPESQGRPETSEYLQYLRTYNTRPAGCTVGPLARERD